MSKEKIPEAFRERSQAKHQELELVQDLYSENYRTLMKEIENYIHKWKDNQCSWIERTNIVKISILSKAIYIFNAKYP